jgi:hypothetical protein
MKTCETCNARAAVPSLRSAVKRFQADPDEAIQAIAHQQPHPGLVLDLAPCEGHGNSRKTR